MYRTLLCAILVTISACVAGCTAGIQGARRQITSSCQLPARAFQGVNRVPVTIPTVKEAYDRLPGMHQVRATVQGTERQVENAVHGL